MHYIIRSVKSPKPAGYTTKQPARGSFEQTKAMRPRENALGRCFIGLGQMRMAYGMRHHAEPSYRLNLCAFGKGLI